MKKTVRKLIAVCLCIALFVIMSGCRESERVSYNISQQADNFNICREITVINVRDDTVLYTLTGFFSLENNSSNELVVLSEVGDGVYKKDFIYLSEWTTYVCTDLTGADVDPYHYELNILPQMMVSNFVITSDN